jgi:protein phosphatase
MNANDISVSVFARTDTGLQRAGNEDAFLVADLTTGNVGLGAKMSTHRVGERGSLMVVSDGMGGAAAGEIASAMAVKTIREALMEEPTESGVCGQLKLATERANQRIWDYANANRKFTGMGATLTAVLIHNTSAYVSQVGDSRAYLIRGDQVKQLTKDQSLVQLLLDAGAIKEDQINSVPQNVIMQALGTSPTIEVAMASVELCKDDLLLVCTDGLSNKITADEMRDIVRKSESLNAACRRLVEMANERGGEDNITVIAARFDGEALHSAAQSNSITGSFKVLSQGCFEGDLAEIGNRFMSSTEALTDEDATTVVLNAVTPAESSPLVEQQSSASGRSRGRNSIFLIATLAALLLLAAYILLRLIS